MERPIVKLAVGALLGFVASFSISLGLIAAVVAFALTVLFGVAWRSFAALAGGLMGMGLTWLVFAGLSFAATLNNGPGSGGGERYVPLFTVAGLLFVAGVVIGLIGIIRARDKSQDAPRTTS
jgi:hypothetical protein